MKKILLIFVAILSTNAFGQDVNQIYNDYVKALGGKEKLANVKSVHKKMLMSMPAQGLEINMESYQSTKGVIFSKMEMMGQEMIALAFDGKQGYKMNQQMGYDDITDKEAGTYTEQAKDIFGSVFRYKEKGDQLSYIGKEKLDDIEYDVLKLNLKTPAEGGVTEMKIYFNPKTHLIDHIMTEVNGMMVDTKIVSYTEVEGVKFVEKIEISMNDQVLQTMTISDIKLNVLPPDANLFVKPKE